MEKNNIEIIWQGSFALAAAIVSCSHRLPPNARDEG